MNKIIVLFKREYLAAVKTKSFIISIILVPILMAGSFVAIPMWQPIVGFLGVVLFTIFSVWVGARIFRTAILIQGQKPSFANLVKYAFRS